MEVLPSLSGAGTLAQWLIALFSGATFAAVLKFTLGWRGQSLDTDEKIRDHYSKEVLRLTARLDDLNKVFRDEMQSMEEHYRKMLDASDHRHEECQKDRDSMRQEMIEMHEEIAGLKRQIAQYSSNRLLVLENGSRPSSVAPDATKSASRVQRVTRDKKDEGDIL
jgi:biopolymer transport protein ExbB/TolQ